MKRFFSMKLFSLACQNAPLLPVPTGKSAGVYVAVTYRATPIGTLIGETGKTRKGSQKQQNLAGCLTMDRCAVQLLAGLS